MLTVTAPDGVPEVHAGDDLADLLLPLVELVRRRHRRRDEQGREQGRGPGGRGRPRGLDHRRDRAAGRSPRDDPDRAQPARADHGRGRGRRVERRARLRRTAPDRSGRLRRPPAVSAIAERTGSNVGVIVTDTAGRAWREGQTDIAIGAAGILVLESYVGRLDEHGNELAVTAPAVADEIASVAELAQGKLGARPFSVVRGRADLVLPPGDDGPGARSLIREDGGDLFGYGAREAVVRAVAGRRRGRRAVRRSRRRRRAGRRCCAAVRLRRRRGTAPASGAARGSRPSSRSSHSPTAGPSIRRPTAPISGCDR